jgi:hypothetical protein
MSDTAVFSPLSSETSWEIGALTRAFDNSPRERQKAAFKREISELERVTRNRHAHQQETDNSVRQEIIRKADTSLQFLLSFDYFAGARANLSNVGSVQLSKGQHYTISLDLTAEDPVYYAAWIGLKEIKPLLFDLKINEWLLRVANNFALSDPSNYSSIVGTLENHIQEFSRLKSNWDGYGAEPIQSESIRHAVEFLKANADLGLSYEPYPDPDGSVGLEGQKGPNVLYLNFAPSGEIAYLLKIGSAVHRGHGADAHAIRKISDAFL